MMIKRYWIVDCDDDFLKHLKIIGVSEHLTSYLTNNIQDDVRNLGRILILCDEERGNSWETKWTWTTIEHEIKYPNYECMGDAKTYLYKLRKDKLIKIEDETKN